LTIVCLFVTTVLSVLPIIASDYPLDIFKLFIQNIVAFNETTNGTYPGPFVTQILHNIEPSDGGESKIFKVMTST
jgi:hypothetical protein